MQFIKIIILSWFIFTLSGCVAGLDERQQREYACFQNDGVLIEDKNPTLGSVLGILPGFGSFYTRNPGRGITNLLLWPISILWEPVNGYNGSMAINYDKTKYKIKKQKQKELLNLENRYSRGELDNPVYYFELQKIKKKYEY
jgi:hypothetical protein